MQSKQPVRPEPPECFPLSLEQLGEMNTLYAAALREVAARLENLNQEFEWRKERNPIQHLTQRLKRPESILEKLHRRGLAEDMDTIRQEIHDIAGIRVVCAYISDLYDMAYMLLAQEDVRLVRRKDYIAQPKPNGYRSLHLLVEVPVYLSSQKQMVPVEIQLRTIAMDFWASLEHELRYKAAEDTPESIRRRLTLLADKVYSADLEMQQLYQCIAHRRYVAEPDDSTGAVESNNHERSEGI